MKIKQNPEYREDLSHPEGDIWVKTEGSEWVKRGGGHTTGGRESKWKGDDVPKQCQGILQEKQHF